MPDFAVRTAFTATDRISPAFNRMGNASDRFGRRANRAFRQASSGAFSFRRILRPLATYLGARYLLRFANQSIQAWRTQEMAVANVNAHLASTNNAIGISSQRLQEMARNWQNVGIFSDEDILQNVTAQLLTFGSIGSQNFNRIQAAAMDITSTLYGVRASGDQLRDVAIMMGIAMDDPIRGFTRLRRRGIQFTREQELQLRAIRRTNGVQAAQVFLLEQIERLYGETNRRLGQTSAGMERLAQMRLGDAMEELGRLIIPFKTQLLQLAVDILPKITERLPAFIEFIKAIAPWALAAAAAFVIYKIALMGITAWYGIMMAAGWVRYLAQMAPLIMRSVRAMGFFQTILKGTTLWQTILAIKTGIVTAATWLFNTALFANPITWVVLGIIALVASIVLLVRHWETVKRVMLSVWDAIKRNVVAAIDYLREKLTGLGHIIMTVLVTPTNLWVEAIIRLLELASNLPGVGDRFARAARSAREFQNAALSALGATNVFAPGEAAGGGGNNINFRGELNINNAPAGSTARGQTRGAPPIYMNLVGANP